MKEGRLRGREEVGKKGRKEGIGREERKWVGEGKGWEVSFTQILQIKSLSLFPTPSDLVQNQTQKQEPLKSHSGMSLWPAT